MQNNQRDLHIPHAGNIRIDSKMNYEPVMESCLLLGSLGNTQGLESPTSMHANTKTESFGGIDFPVKSVVTGRAIGCNDSGWHQ